MTWSRKHTLIAGIALIALSNAVALIGVAYNRSGEPESELRLSSASLRRRIGAASIRKAEGSISGCSGAR